MDVGGTIPRMESVESSQEQRPRATQEQLAAKRLIEHLQHNPTDHLLDVCTGTVTYCRGEKSVVSTLFTFYLQGWSVYQKSSGTILVHYSFFIVFSWWDVVWNAGWRSFLNQMSDKEQKVFEKHHLKEIAEVIGDDGVWFNTEALIAVGTN